MTINPTQICLDARQREYEQICQQYKELTSQLLTTRDADDQVTLQERSDRLEQKMQETFNQIAKLKAQMNPGSAAQIRQEQRTWESKFCKIDYKKANGIFDKVCKRLEEAGGDVLFLLYESSTKKGDLCLQELKDRLQGMRAEMTEPREIAFNSYESADEQRFLSALSAYYAEPETTELPIQNLDRLVPAIQKSLFSGAIFYLQITIKCPLEEDNKFLSWFIDDFWRSLTAAIAPSQRIRLVAVVSVDGTIPNSCLPETAFSNRGRIADRTQHKLPLTTWNKQDIHNWLIDCSGLNRPPVQLSDANIRACHQLSQITAEAR